MTENAPLYPKNKSPKTLLIGAGGVGCEVLKNLAITGFDNITVIDLDHIELSNLNRQFLFRNKHIGQSKALIATETVKKMNPSAKIIGINDNIKSPQFDVEWFSSFDIVVNALDNLDARRHVNMMCQAADIPLIETGTAGYTGQTSVIKRGITECFECQPKPTEQKVYPVCTIRNTPTALIHCVVWAKDYLFIQLFGGESAKNKEVDMELDQDNQEEMAMMKESQKLKTILECMDSSDFGKMIFDSMFGNNINELLSMEDMWKNRTKPNPIFYNDYYVPNSDNKPSESLDDKEVLSTVETFRLWLSSLEKLKNTYKDNKINGLTFDKDDKDALEFVGCSANLRAIVFGISCQSLFQIKAMAGNIIPAIATTNAIVAGVAVVQASKIISGQLEKCKTVYFAYGGRRPQFMYKEPLLPPNKKCTVCQAFYYTVSINFKLLLSDLIALVSKTLSKEIPERIGEDFSLLEGNRILYDPDFDDNLGKSFEELGIKQNSILTIEPETDLDTVNTIILCIVPSTENSLEIKIKQGNNKIVSNQDIKETKKRIDVDNATNGKRPKESKSTLKSVDEPEFKKAKIISIDIPLDSDETIIIKDD
ncbi:hypothetical protein BB558_005199 [Smittium angustum]|uniref:Ubiquitin-activating enzyme E1-like n=1 Tax=Smittium angustum TaxID=133377 RepID=A0A2U1J149_SMIAN|nr:hypothetical protein BB558_005199 [Smittium angustum]